MVSTRAARPDSMRIDASVTRRAKRSGRMPAGSRFSLRPRRPFCGSSSSTGAAGGARGPRSEAPPRGAGSARCRRLERALVALGEERGALLVLGLELGRADEPRVLAEAERPGHERTRARVVRAEELPTAVGLRELPVAAEVPLDLPGDAVGDPHLGGAGRLAELPPDALGVGPRVEVLGALEVVLGLRRIAALPADPGEAEDADRVALVRAADEVELAALEEELVGVEPPVLRRVPLPRVVGEGDGLAAG